MTKVLENM